MSFDEEATGVDVDACADEEVEAKTMAAAAEGSSSDKPFPGAMPAA